MVAEVGGLVAETEKVMGVPVGPEDVVAAGKCQETLFAAVLEQDLLLENRSAEAVVRAVAGREIRLAAEQGPLEKSWVAESSDSEQRNLGIDTLADPEPIVTLRE